MICSLPTAEEPKLPIPDLAIGLETSEAKLALVIHMTEIKNQHSVKFFFCHHKNINVVLWTTNAFL